MCIPTWGIESERRWTLSVTSATNVTVCVSFHELAVTYGLRIDKKGGRKGAVKRALACTKGLVPFVVKARERLILFRNPYATETGRVLPHRAAYCGCDHFDHRRYRDSKLPQIASDGQRGVNGGISPNYQYSGSGLFDELRHWLCPAG